MARDPGRTLFEIRILAFFVSVVFRVSEIIVTIFWREVSVSNEPRLDASSRTPESGEFLEGAQYV